MWKNFHNTIDKHWSEHIDAAMANVWIIYDNVLKMCAFQLGAIREDDDMYFKWVVYQGAFTFSEFGTLFNDNAENVKHAQVLLMQHDLNLTTFTLDMNKGDLRVYNYNSIKAHEEICQFKKNTVFPLFCPKCTSQTALSKHHVLYYNYCEDGM